MKGIISRLGSEGGNCSRSRDGDKRVIVECILYGVQDPYGIFLGRGDVASNAAENGSPLLCTETSRDFLFDFDHSNITFGLVIVKRDAKVIHKGKHFAFVLAQPIQQIFGWGLFGSAPFLFVSVLWFGGWVLGKPC